MSSVDVFSRSGLTRPRIDLTTGSADAGPSSPLRQEQQWERNSEDEDEDSLESLTSRLNVEGRIQYGAEKFLEALDSATCSIPVENRPALRAKVGQELESSNIKIRDLRSRIESIASPSKPSKNFSVNLGGLGPSASPANPTYGSSRTGQSSTNGDRGVRALSHVTSASTLSSSVSSEPLRLHSYSLNDQMSGESLANSVVSETWVTSPGKASSGASPHSSQETWEPLGEEDIAQARFKANTAVARLVKIKDGAKDGKWSIPLVQRLFNAIASAAKISPQLRSDLNMEQLSDILMTFIAEPGESRLRASGYRLCRILLVDGLSWSLFQIRGLEWLLVKTLARVPRAVPEVEQAILLIRAVMILPRTILDSARPSAEVPSEVDGFNGLQSNHPPTLTGTLIRALVSCAENPDDPYSAVCLETLAELALIDLRCLRHADAYRVVLRAAEEGGTSGSVGLCGALLALFDSPIRRSEMPIPSGLEVFTSSFTQAYGNGAMHLERLRISSFNVLYLLRSWSGLFSCSMGHQQGIASLVEALKVPVVEMREALLDLIFSLLRVKVPQWYQPYLDVSNMKLVRHSDSRVEPPDGSDTSRVDSPNGELNLVDHFVALILVLLVEAGFVEALVDLVQENQSALTQKATLLLGETLNLCNRLLPIKYCARVQALPRLFEMAAKFEIPEARTPALSALDAVDVAHRSSAEPTRATHVHHSSDRPRALSPNPRARQVAQEKSRLGRNMDDRQFQSLLVESQILTTKDHSKWNFEAIMDVLQGPLLTARRLEEAFVASKFGRRLLQFFQPRNRRFSDIRLTSLNKRWIDLLLALIRTLLATPEGIQLLVEDKLLKQVLDGFSELDQYAGQPAGHPFFSRARIETTLSQGYFDVIGLMSEQPQGMKLLERFGFFTCFYHLTELKSRDDLIRAIIERFDYTIDGHPRIMLSKALTSSYMRLGRLIEEKHLSTWSLESLVTQLYDPARQVRDAAAHYIKQACDAPDVLEAVVKLHPILDHLGDVGQSLLMRFLSTSAGFAYLRDADYIDREIDEWFEKRNSQYVIQVEAFLSHILDTPAPPPTSSEVSHLRDRTTPPHFYAQITKTEEGCLVLREKGHFQAFVAFIREHGMECSDSGVILKLKSVLWAVGHIGSTLGGVPFLDDEEIVDTIVQIAETSEVLSVRGTCYHVLGLISTTMQGAEILEDQGWLAVTSTSGITTGLCLPDDLSKFMNIPEWQTRPPDEPLHLPELEDTAYKRILSGISALSNEVVGTQALGRLQYFKAKQPQSFRSIDLFARVCYMLSTGHYKQVARAYAINMFDIRLTKSNLEAIEAKLEALKREARQIVAASAGAVGESTGGGNNAGWQRTIAKARARASIGLPARGTTAGTMALEPKSKVTGFAGVEEE